MADEENVQGLDAEPKTYDEDYVKGLRGEAAGYRVEAKKLKEQVETLTKQVSELEDKDKPTVERLTKRNSELEKAMEELVDQVAGERLMNKIVAEAAKQNVVNPEIAYKLLDTTDLEDDPKSIKKAVEGLVKENPYLAKEAAPQPTPGPGGPPLGTGGQKSTDEQWGEILRGAASGT